MKLNRVAKSTFSFLYSHISDAIVLLASLLFIGLILFGMGNYSASEALGYAAFVLFIYISFALVFHLKVHDDYELFARFKDSEIKIFDKNANKDSFAIIVSILIGLIFILFSFRQLILVPGIVNAEIIPFWPKFTIPSLLPFNPLNGYTAGNDRFLISDIYIALPSLFLKSIILAQVLQTLLQFILVYVIAILVARSVHKVLKISINKVTFYTIFGLISVLNPVFLVEGSVFAIDSLLMVYIFMIILRNLDNHIQKNLDFLKLGYAISFMIFLDPRYIILLFICLLLFLFISFMYKAFISIFKLIAKSALLWIPFAILLIIMFHFTPNYLANQGRSGSVLCIIGYSTNTDAINIWAMLGNYWSDFVFSSPEIISLSKIQIEASTVYGYSNALMLYFKGFLQIAWAVLMGAFSLISVASLYFIWKEKADRKLQMLLIPFIVLFTLVLGGNIGVLPIVQLESAISSIPLVGGIWAVTVAITPWLQGSLVSFFLIFFSYSISNINKLQFVNLYKNEAEHRRRRKINLNHIVIFAIVIVVLLPSWQLVFPEYSLGAVDPGLPGNHVSLVGPYYPSYPPNSFVKLYSNLSAHSNLTYSVYSNDEWFIPEKWDSGILSIGGPGVPPANGFSSIFSEIFADNLSNDVIPLSEMYGVKYFFIDNSTTANVTPLIKFLDSSGLSVYYADKNLTVFESPTSSNIVPSSFLLGYSRISNISILDAYSALVSQAIYPTFLNAPEMLNLELANFSNNSTISLLDYQNCFKQQNEFPSLFGPPLQGFSNATFTDIYNEWNIFDPGNSYYAKYTVDNNSFNIIPETSDRSATTGTVHIDYQSPMFNGVTDILVPDYKTTLVSIHGTINYSLRGSSDGISLSFPTNNGSLVSNGVTSVNLPSGLNMTYNFTSILPKNSRAFSAELTVASLNGTFSVSDLSMSYAFTYRGSSYINDSMGIQAELSSGSYHVIVNGFNKELIPVVANSNITVSKNTRYNLNIANLSYLSYAVIIPSYLENNSRVPLIEDLKYDNLTASLRFYTDNATRYISISYNPTYHWASSHNLKYVGTNSLGIEIFKLESSGFVEIYIPGSYVLSIALILAAIMINGILPLIIFIIYPGLQKKLKR